jgi:hypothetical protein
MNTSNTAGMPARNRAALSRRGALRLGAAGATGLALSSLRLPSALAVQPVRAQAPMPSAPPEIQYDISSYVPPARMIDGTLFRFGPVFTLFVTARLTRVPTQDDQRALARALAMIEERYPFDPTGVFTFLAYGLPYFDRLPGGRSGSLVARSMPRMIAEQERYALEEAIPAPTDISPLNPNVAKRLFNVPLAIESNDLLITLRSDVAEHLTDVADWLIGSDRLRGEHMPSPPLDGLLEITSRRAMWVQPGLPRRVAEANKLPYADREHPDSPLWMGFASQQADSSGPAEITTFQGNRSAVFTNTKPGDYFASGSIQHLSHVIIDLEQWYADPYVERVQNMFRSNDIPHEGHADQFTDGGGPAYLPNPFQGRDDARRNAAGIKTYRGARRLGHTSALQRSSRAADGTPVHIRVDGSGFDSMDVPDGSEQPKLQFSIFVPTAAFFARMRRYMAGSDLAEASGVDPHHAGLDRFITTTRAQNFLVPPRAHRAFPLVEFT